MSGELVNTIQRILDVPKTCEIDKIEIVGHTDTFGGHDENLHVSDQRASLVERVFLLAGLEASKLSSYGLGEWDLFIDTGDGVKEQLNRRVAIVMQLTSVPRNTSEPIVSDKVINRKVSDLCTFQYRKDIIYYDFEKEQSTETKSLINRILDEGQYCDVKSIHIVGYTDTTGSATYNQKLSSRRAQTLRNELVKRGLKPEITTFEGKGEIDPIVVTGDGVKEPLNNRIEVLMLLY